MRNLAVGLLIISLLMNPYVAKAQLLHPDDTLVLCLAFDEGEGDVAKDSSQYRNDGTLIGNIGWVDGKFGKALKFDGSPKCVEVPHSESLNVESSFTIENWVYIEDRSRTVTIAEKGYQVGNWRTSMQTLHGFVFCLGVLDGWGGIATSVDSALYAKVWYHLAATWDGEWRKLYVNGELDGRDKPEGSLEPNTNPVTIGAERGEQGSLGLLYDGLIDEFRIWNRALSENEIKASMAMGTDKLFPVELLDNLATTWGSIKKF